MELGNGKRTAYGTKMKQREVYQSTSRLAKKSSQINCKEVITGIIVMAMATGVIWKVRLAVMMALMAWGENRVRGGCRSSRLDTSAAMLVCRACREISR